MVQNKIILINEFITKEKGSKEVKKRLRELDDTQRRSTKGRKDFLTQFTKVRWAIVNVALIGAVVAGLGKLIFSAEKTRFEMVRLAQVSNASFKTTREAILDLRDKTLASNEEMIESFQELAKSGFDLAEQQDILTASAGASLVGFASLKETALATAQVMRQFSLSSSEASDIAFKLAGAANAGRVDINTLGQAFKFSGAIASQTGTSFEELAASTAILSNKGLQMTQIGRGQRQALLSLLAPSTQAEAVMEAFRIETTNANGSLKSFTEIMTEFDDKLSGLSEAEKLNVIGKIFPSNAITIILESLGKTNDEVIELTKNLEEMGSEAVINAFILQQENAVTLKGQWEKLTFAIKESTDAVVQFFSRRPFEEFDPARLKEDILKLDIPESTRKKVENIRPRTQFTGFLEGQEGIEKVFTVQDVELFLKIFKEYGTLDIPIFGIYSNFLDTAAKDSATTAVDMNKIKVAQEELGPTMVAVSEAIQIQSKNYEVANKKLAEFNEIEKKVKEELGDTEEAQLIINQLFKEFTTILGGADEGGKSVVTMLTELRKSQDETIDSTELYKQAIRDLRNELDDVNDSLSDTRDKIRDTNEQISNILSRRFKIRGISETNIGDLIRKQQVELDRARFATLGLGTAEDFLRGASVLSADAINEQTEAIMRLTAAASDGQNQFDAWQTTLRETIRSLLLSSQDIDKDVTEVIRKAQTELLSITRADRQGGDQFSVMEQNLEALGLAQNIFFGEEQNKLQFSEELREDRINGMNESAAQAISNLETERSALEMLIEEEIRWIALQAQKRAEIEKNRIAIERSRGLTGREAAILAIPGGTITDPELFEQRVGKEALERKRAQGLVQAQDFISRPGQPIQSFSPQDTIIGVKGGTQGVGTTNNVTIIIEGFNKNPQELAIEVQRQINALA